MNALKETVIDGVFWLIWLALIAVSGLSAWAIAAYESDLARRDQDREVCVSTADTVTCTRRGSR